MSDKMREEFEGWFWGEFHKDSDVELYRDSVFATTVNGDYRGMACNAYWTVWQASRAAHGVGHKDDSDPSPEIAELKRQRDELLAALTYSRGMLGNAAMRMKWFDISKAQEILRGVDIIDKPISKSKGGAA